MSSTRALLTGCLLLGCATAPAPAPLPDEPPPAVATAPSAPSPPPPPTCTAFARPGVLRRSAINQALNASLGRWLAGVEVEAAVQKGRFRGWTVRSLHSGDPCYRDVDVRTGDVVVRVNGKSIERPEQANEVFQSLRTAPALEVELVRAGAPVKLTFPIVEE
jgi:type II secretory pathway component PulC